LFKEKSYGHLKFQDSFKHNCNQNNNTYFLMCDARELYDTPFYPSIPTEWFKNSFNYKNPSGMAFPLTERNLTYF
jgi:hypothetical protein